MPINGGVDLIRYFFFFQKREYLCERLEVSFRTPYFVMLFSDSVQTDIDLEINAFVPASCRYGIQMLNPETGFDAVGGDR